MLPDLIIQGIGLLGTAGNVCAYQFKNRKIFYALQFCGAFLFMVQFALLGSWAGCLLNFVAVIRTVLLLTVKSARKIRYLVLICILFTIATAIIILFKFDSYLALLPWLACILQSIGIWNKSPKKTRWYQLLGSSPEWMVYNIYSHSIGGVICECFAICSSIIYLARHKNDDESDVKE